MTFRGILPIHLFLPVIQALTRDVVNLLMSFSTNTKFSWCSAFRKWKEGSLLYIFKDEQQWAKSHRTQFRDANRRSSRKADLLRASLSHQGNHILLSSFRFSQSSKEENSSKRRKVLEKGNMKTLLFSCFKCLPGAKSWVWDLGGMSYTPPLVPKK